MVGINAGAFYRYFRSPDIHGALNLLSPCHDSRLRTRYSGNGRHYRAVVDSTARQLSAATAGADAALALSSQPERVIETYDSRAARVGDAVTGGKLQRI